MDGKHWDDWQRSWDRQQEWYLPDREERFRVMLDTVEAHAGRAPRVLDLACGTGSISERLLAACPGPSVSGSTSTRSSSPSPAATSRPSPGSPW